MQAHMVWVSARDLFDAELGGSDDRTETFEIASTRRPNELQPAGSLTGFQLAAEIRLESEPCSLQDCRNGGTDDILAVLGKTRMATSRKTRDAAYAVAVERDLQQGRATGG